MRQFFLSLPGKRLSDLREARFAPQSECLWVRSSSSLICVTASLKQFDEKRIYEIKHCSRENALRWFSAASSDSNNTIDALYPLACKLTAELTCLCCWRRQINDATMIKFRTENYRSANSIHEEAVIMTITRFKTFFFWVTGKMHYAHRTSRRRFSLCIVELTSTKTQSSRFTTNRLRYLCTSSQSFGSDWLCLTNWPALLLHGINKKSTWFSDEFHHGIVIPDRPYCDF